MLQPHELAAAQGFPQGYQFTGNKTEQVRQIGNAVPCGFSRALIAAHLTGNGDVRDVMRRAANTEKLIMKGGSSESVCL
jgi:hypothetical protein